MTKPNEQSGVIIQGHVKIHDPKTGEVLISISG